MSAAECRQSSSPRRLATVLVSGAREYRRTPLLLALIVGMPAYAIWVFTAVMPDAQVVFQVDGQVVTARLPTAAGAFMTPMTAALLTAIAGLFLMESAESDGRLVVAGYRPAEVVLARLGLLGLVAAVATLVSVAVASTTFSPDQALAFGAAVWLAALIYGMAGVLVGTTLDRLPAVYLLLFGSMIDFFLFQNPLATDQHSLAVALPGYFPMEAAMAAGFTGGVDPATFAFGGVVLAILTAAGTLAFYRRMRLG